MKRKFEYESALSTMGNQGKLNYLDVEDIKRIRRKNNLTQE